MIRVSVESDEYIYLLLRRIYKFDFSIEGHAVLVDISIAGSDQTGLLGRFVLSVQVKAHINFERPGLLSLRHIKCADEGQFAAG